VYKVFCALNKGVNYTLFHRNKGFSLYTKHVLKQQIIHHLYFHKSFFSSVHENVILRKGTDVHERNMATYISKSQFPKRHLGESHLV